MVHPQYAVYLGREQKDGFTGFVATDTFFAILDIPEGSTPVKGRSIMDHIAGKVKKTPIGSLAAFDEAITSSIKEMNMPLDFSFAGGCLVGTILYLKTIGDGELYLRRGDSFERLITGHATASGYIEEGDLFVMTTAFFTKSMEGMDKLRTLFDHKKPAEIVDELTPSMKERDDSGAVCFLLQLQKEPAAYADETPAVPASPVDSAVYQPPRKSSGMDMPMRSFFRSFRHQRKRVLLFAVVGIIFALLLFNVVRSFGKKKTGEAVGSWQQAKTEIADKLARAKETAVDMQGGLAAIAEVRKQLAETKKTLPKDAVAQWQDLMDQTTTAENTILKRTEGTAEEFQDLAQEKKNATGVALALWEDDLVIPGKDGTFFRSSLEKKTLSSKTVPELSGSHILAVYDKAVFFLRSGGGIYKLDEAGKTKEIIPKDDEWGTITDMKVYNGNIYLLDTEKDEIYKYLVADGGYSGKNSYVKSGQAISMTKANSLAIDTSVYLGFPDTIIKYLSGSRETFTLTLPKEGVTLSKVMAVKEDETLYAWSKQEGLIYLFTKDGTYQRQVHAPAFAAAADVVTYKGVAYVLSGGKLLRIALE